MIYKAELKTNIEWLETKIEQLEQQLDKVTALQLDQNRITRDLLEENKGLRKAMQGWAVR